METIVIAFIAIVAVIIVVSNVMGRGKPGRGNDNASGGGDGFTYDAGGDSGGGDGGGD